MKKFFWFLVSFGAFALLVWMLLPSWGGWQNVTVWTGDGQKLNVRYADRPCVYVGFPHAKGFYLSSGETAVQVRIGESQEYTFNIDQELDVVAVQLFDQAIYLVFMAEYQPGRGMLVYQSDDKSFRRIDAAKLPPQIAFPNLTERADVARGIITSESANDVPPPEFYDTLSAWMWSQMVTNKAVLAEGLDTDAVDQFWSKWRKEIAKQMAIERPLSN